MVVALQIRGYGSYRPGPCSSWKGEVGRERCGRKVEKWFDGGDVPGIEGIPIHKCTVSTKVLSRPDI